MDRCTTSAENRSSSVKLASCGVALVGKHNGIVFVKTTGEVFDVGGSLFSFWETTFEGFSNVMMLKAISADQQSDYAHLMSA